MSDLRSESEGRAVTFNDGGRGDRSAGRNLSLPLYRDEPLKLPATVGDCRGPGICPLFRCRYNLALDVTEAGTLTTGARGCTGRGASIPLRRRGKGRIKPRDMARFDERILELLDRVESTCALDYAETGGMSLERIGKLTGVSREAVRKSLAKAVDHIRAGEDTLETFIELSRRGQ